MDKISKTIKSAALFYKCVAGQKKTKQNKMIFVFFTTHIQKKRPFPSISKAYFLIEGQVEIQLSTKTIVCLPNTIHPAQESTG